MQKQLPNGYIKKMLREFSEKSQENTCAKSHFLKRPQRWYFHVSFAKFLRTSFFESTTGGLLLIIAESTVVKRDQANITFNYDTEIKTYQVEPEV